MRATRITLVAAVLAVATNTAAADDPPFTIGGRPVWFLTAGPTAGGTVATGARGGFVGGEVSLSRTVEAHYLGMYVDAYRDFGVDGTYLTFGPEAGWIRRSRFHPFSLGVDGGGAVRFADERAFGATGRVYFVVYGTFAVFARYSYLDATEDDQVVQLGVTIKFPLAPPFGPATHH
jgi:hypothetical protein